MSSKPMRLVMRKPAESGLTLVLGTRLFTPDGSEVTGIASASVAFLPGEVVETTVVLRQVVIEYEDGAP